MIGATDREDRQLSSPRSSLYRGPAEQPSASPAISASPALCLVPRGSTAAARKVTEVFSLAGIEIGGGGAGGGQGPAPRPSPTPRRGGALDELGTRVHRANLPALVGGWEIFWLALKGRVFNLQRRSQAAEVAHVHYDLGNDVYQAMLDRRMQYTCAYWQDASTLDQAQESKLGLICRKMQLQPGMTVLELGGGFGGLAQFMASQYGCRVVMYNMSAAQVAYGREWCRNLPVRIEQKDYREAARETGGFDRVVSVGLCEHIGQKNYREFLELAHRLLNPGGVFLLHTIGGNESYTCTDAWIDKYIFPNGLTPSVAQLGKAMEGRWVVEDWHNFGPDYDPTLMAWWHNFDRAWPSLQARYGERFYRMWKYYLLGCAGGFRARRLQLWQLVLSKGDIPGYTPVR